MRITKAESKIATAPVETPYVASCGVLKALSNVSESCIIPSMEEFEPFPWVAANGFSYNRLHRTPEHLPVGVEVLPVSGYVFARIWKLTGFKNSCIAPRGEPELLSQPSTGWVK